MAGRATSAAVLSQIVSSILQIGLAIAIIAIVRNDLFFGVYFAGPVTTTTITTCLLSTDGDNRMCNYAYSLASINLLASVMLIVAACILAGRGAGLACGNLFLGIWMLVGAIVVTIYAHDANDLDYPQGNYRNAIIALLWTSFALALLMFAGSMFMMARRKRGEDAADDGMTKPGAYDAEQPRTAHAMPSPASAPAPAGYPAVGVAAPAGTGYPAVGAAAPAAAP